MAKCAICEKAVSHGNKISIARSHVSRRASSRWRNKNNSSMFKMSTFWKSKQSII